MSARLIVQRHPVDPSSRTFEDVPAGARLGPLLDSRTPPQLRERHVWTARANGRVLTREELATYELRDGDLVTCRVRPRDPITIGIAILSALGVGGTTAAGFAIAGSVALGTAAALTVGAAVLVGANLLVSKLLGPKPPSQTRATGSAAPFYSLSGSRNELRRGAAFQTHFGTMRVVPDQLLPALTHVSPVDGSVSVKYLFVVGKGQYDISDLRLRDTLLSEYNPTIQLYDGSGAQLPSEALSHFTTNVNELPVNIDLLDKAVGSARIVQTTALVCTSFTAVLVFGRGIWAVDYKGRPLRVQVRLKVEYRTANSSDPWIVLYDVIEDAYHKKPIVRNIGSDTLTPGQYDVAVQLLPVNGRGRYGKDRDGTENTISGRVSDLSWLSLQSSVPGAPFDDAGLADICMFGVELKASEVLNGALDQVSCIASRLLPTFDGASWGAPAATSNPGWAFSLPLRERDGDAAMDAAEIKRWADYCDEQNWQFNHTFNDAGSSSVGEVAGMAALSGQASYVKKGSLHSIALDELKTSPVAIFTGDKIQSLTVSRVDLDPLHAVRCSFVNAEAGYQLDELTVYLPGYSRENATEIQVLELVPGVVYANQLQRHLLREIARRRLRTRTYNFKDAYYDGLTIFKGDMFELAHARALHGLSETRVAQYTTRLDGSPAEDCVDEIELARPITMEAGRTYGLRVALSTGEPITIPLANPLTAGRQDYYVVAAAGAVPVPTYEDDDEQVVVDDLTDAVASFGDLGTETVELLVLGIEYDENLLATITATTYSPEVQTADSVPIPDHVPVTGRVVGDFDSTPPVPVFGSPRSTFLRMTETGAPLVDLVLPVRPGTPVEGDAQTGSYRLQWRLHFNDFAPEEWHTEPPIEAATSAELVVPAIEGSQTIDVRAFAISRHGVLSSPTALLGLNSLGTVSPPQAVAASSDVRLDPVAGARTLVRLEWSYAVPQPRPDTIVRYRKDSGEWVSVPAVVETFVELFGLEPGEYEFELRARLFGELSELVTSNVTVFAPGSVPSTARPSGLELLIGGVRAGSSREFTGRSVTFVWNPLSYDGSLREGYSGLDEAPPDALLDGWVARILDPDTFALVREERPQADSSSYTYAYDAHAEDGLRRSLRFELRVRDRLGNLSNPAVLGVSNSAPPALESTVVDAVAGAVFLTLPVPEDPDLAGVLVWADNTPGFLTSAGNLVVDAALTPGGAGSASFFWPEGTTAYFRIAFYDAFGREDLNISEEFDVEVPSAFELTEGIITDTELAADLRRGLSAAYSNGFETSSDVSAIVIPDADGTVSPSSGAFSGSLCALFTWNGAAPSASSNEAPHLLMPARTALAISGQRVRVQLYAKRPASNPSTQFRVCLDVGAGNSGWQEFAPTTSWAPYSFLYAVPTITDPTVLKLRIQGDSDGASEAGSGQGVLIDSVAVFPLLEQITSSNASTHVGAGAVGNTELGTSSVSTSTIQSNAVSVSANAITDSGINVDDHINWTTVQSVSYTSSGASVILNCYARIIVTAGDGNPRALNVRLVRGGGATVVSDMGTFTFDSSAGGLLQYPWSGVATDTPPSGSITYELQVKFNSVSTSATSDVYNRTIVILEMKR